MLSGTVLKQFRIYLKSQVGHGWSVEGRKSKGRLLTRVSFRYLSGERSVVLLDIDFNAEYQDDIVRTVRKLSDLMRERNVELDTVMSLSLIKRVSSKIYKVFIDFSYPLYDLATCIIYIGNLIVF